MKELYSVGGTDMTVEYRTPGGGEVENGPRRVVVSNCEWQAQCELRSRETEPFIVITEAATHFVHGNHEKFLCDLPRLEALLAAMVAPRGSRLVIRH